MVSSTRNTGIPAAAHRLDVPARKVYLKRGKEHHCRCHARSNSPQKAENPGTNAAVHWQSSEDARWAKNLLHNHAMRLDWDYLWQRAREEGTAQVLEALWHEVQRHDETHEAE
jgi:hypothetical protein